MNYDPYQPHTTEVHFNFGPGGYLSCLCNESCCLTSSGGCVCPGCDCRNPEIPPRNHIPEVLDVAELGSTDSKGIVRRCKTCDALLVRPHARGRWPLYCGKHRR